MNSSSAIDVLLENDESSNSHTSSSINMTKGKYGQSGRLTRLVQHIRSSYLRNSAYPRPKTPLHRYLRKLSSRSPALRNSLPHHHLHPSAHAISAIDDPQPARSSTLTPTVTCAANERATFVSVSVIRRVAADRSVWGVICSEMGRIGCRRRSKAMTRRSDMRGRSVRAARSRA